MHINSEALIKGISILNQHRSKHKEFNISASGGQITAYRTDKPLSPKLYLVMRELDWHQEDTETYDVRLDWHL